MFVLLEGRTKDEAFVIGQQIADAVTNDNPKPVKLKLEKVGHSVNSVLEYRVTSALLFYLQVVL